MPTGNKSTPNRPLSFKPCGDARQAFAQTCGLSRLRSVKGSPRHPFSLCLLVVPQLLLGPCHGALSAAWALRIVAHACAWASNICSHSVNTWQMISLPMVGGP